MKQCYPALFLLFSFFSSTITKAQNITGTWEGYFNNEYLQLNVQQKNNELCGFTYDFEMTNRNSYCIANFNGRYDREKKIYYLTGTGFIENSGSHVLMRIILWKSPEDNSSTMQGKVVTGSNVLSIFGMGGENISLTKISRKPKTLEGYAAPCFPKPVAKNPEIKNPNKKVPADKEVSKKAGTEPEKKVKEKNDQKPIAEIPKNKSVKPEKNIPVKKDSTRTNYPQPAEIVKDMPKNPLKLERLMATRKQSEQSRISIDVKEINLKLYDNGTVDNDTVSVFYNGKLLLSHQRLSEKAIELNIQLEEGISQHEITLFAENLGSIPPNTSLVVVTAGNKRYELRSKASMEENAVLVFEYKPK